MAFLLNLSMRLEDFDYRRTGLCHGNPLAHPHPRAESSESDRPRLDQVLVPPYLIVNVLTVPVHCRDEVRCPRRHRRSARPSQLQSVQCEVRRRSELRGGRLI